MPARRPRAAREKLDEVVRQVYPLIVNRREARVPLLALAHAILLRWAQRRTPGGYSRAYRWYRMTPTDWADMALRLMLEYERGETWSANGKANPFHN